MDENDLRAKLAAAVPDAPGVTDRAAGARTRARRNRRRMLAGAAVAVAVAIAVPVAAFGPADEHATKPLKDGEPGGFHCPIGEAKDDPGPVAADAIRVRLCAPDTAGSVQVPLDTLGGARAAALATWLGELEVLEPAKVCDLRLHPTYGFVFGYADGSTHYLTSNGSPCSRATVRGSHSDELFQRFTAGLLAQRDELGGPGERIVPPLTGDLCDRGAESGGPGFSLLPPDPDDLRPTVLCVPRGQLSAQETSVVRLAAEEVDLMVEDLRGGLITDDELDDRYPLRCTISGTPPPYLIAWNRWGDRFELQRNECNPAFTVYLSGAFRGYAYWDPGPGAAAVLDGLAVEGERPLDLPRASSSPDEVVALWLDLADADDPRANGLWLEQAPSYPRGTFVTGKVAAAHLDGDTAEVDYLFSAERETARPVYRHKTFRLVRDSGTEPWRIESWTDQGPE